MSADSSPVDGQPTDSPSAWCRRAPAAPLRPFVRGYLGYRTTGLPRRIHRGLPSSDLTFIVSIDRPIDVLAQTDPAQRPDSYRCVLSGLQLAPALIEEAGESEGVAIELTPLGLRRIAGLPASALWNRSHECADVLGAPGDELWEGVNSAATWTDRFAACDRVLMDLAGRQRDSTVPREIERAWGLLASSGGAMTVGDVAADVGWSRQHLTRRFRAELGMGPKSLARVVRFQRVVGALRSGWSGGLADLAAISGYADQSHLDRDFGRLAGCTPTQWIVDEVVPNVLDG